MAEELARSSGTTEEVIQKVLAQDFLTKCLRKAKFSADLLQDTLDACDINDLNALVLGSGLLTVTQASEKLFLMQDEANTVVTVCRKECLRAGVNFGDGAQLTPEELAENDDEEPAAPAPAPVSAPPPVASVPTHPAIQVPAASTYAPTKAASPVATDAKQPQQSQASSGVSVLASTPVQAAAVATPTSLTPTAQETAKETASATTAALEQRPSTTTPTTENLHSETKPPGSGTSIPPPPAATTPSSARSHIPKPTIATPATPAAAVATPRERPVGKPVTRASPPVASASPPTSSGGAQDSAQKSTVTPSMNGKHTSSSSAAKPPRPSSAPLSARASTTAPLGKDRPSSALATPPLQQTSKLPSYAKPTASHKARLLKEDTDVPSTSAAPPITFASTNKPLRRLLYMPPRPTSTTPEEKKEPKKPIFDNIRSNLLRPTAAFLAWSSGKSKSSNTPDMRASQALQGDMSRSLRGPNSAPPKSRDFSSTQILTPSQTLGPVRQTTTPEPFRLASAERHQKAQEELARKKEEKARLESQIPKFKASPMPSPAMVAKSESKRTSTGPTDA